MLAGVGVWAFRSGDPAKLLYPTNSFGQICGQVDPDYHQGHQTINVNHHLIKQGGQASRPFLLFFDLTKVESAPPIPLPKKENHSSDGKRLNLHFFSALPSPHWQAAPHLRQTS